MAALDPSVAAVRHAVAAALTGLPRGALVLVACSGGADSMSLASAAAFVVPRAGMSAGLVSVDHGLQDGSDTRATAVVAWGEKAGFAPSAAVAVDVATYGGGPEAAARDARYAALVGAAREYGASAVLLGHTRDDQAETVLLGLARGAGPRGLSGMSPVRHQDGIALIRPLLAIDRATTRAACAAENLAVWEDPHNVDPRYTRVRVRQAMSTLTDALGLKIVANLARTAGLIAADSDALDAIAAAARIEAKGSDGTLDCAALHALPDAVRTRVLRLFALDAGAPGGALSAAHIVALDALVMSWHGQGAVALPGGYRVSRRANRLIIDAAQLGNLPQ